MCMSPASRCVHSSECFDASGSSLHLGMCLIEETTVLLVDITRGCEFHATPTGVGRKALHLPKSSGFVNDGRGYFGGRGIARLPSSSHFRDHPLPQLRGLGRRKDWLFSLPPHNTGNHFGGGGQAFLLTPSVSTSCQRSGRTMS